MKIVRSLLIVFALATTAFIISCRQDHTVSSPNGKIEVRFDIVKGKPVYSVLQSGKAIIETSQLGLMLDTADLTQGLELIASNTSTFDEIWSQPWGEVKNIRNHYNEGQFTLQQKAGQKLKMNITFKVYNDGVGFRYEIPSGQGLGAFNIIDEVTTFNMASDMKAWWIPAYAEATDSELEFTATAISQIGQQTHTPLTMESGDSLFISIHEAALVDYAAMMLEPNGTTLKTALVPWSTGELVRCNESVKSSWRSIQIAGSAGELMTSYLVLNLNDPNQLEDLSYVKPGKYNGIWWGMHLGTYTWNSGPKHGANTDTTMKYIDFAAANGLSGVLVEGWNEGWDYDWSLGKFVFDKPYQDFDIKALSAYAKSKGVGLIGHHETGGNIENYEAQMEDAFKFCQENGITAVKTGYVATKPSGEYHQSQFMVRHHQRVVETAAKYGVMIDIHEPVKATGLRRTYPNLMTREGAKGTEYEAWSAGNSPSHTVTLPFTRCLAGPLDYTPGIFEIMLEPRPKNRVHTTLAKQLALYVTLYSPLQMAADLPENYEGQPAFQFIRDVPTDWEDTKVLNAKIGSHLTVVRKDRNSDDWFLGATTGDSAIAMTTNLDFLLPGKRYEATIYADGADANWVSNPTDIQISKSIVAAEDMLALNLAPGGGQAIRFRLLD